ncbi:hypothetical protein KUTeg_004380 [Tegillarca granosa]|uniref:Uncharacterized protein n=1 Tax=Tegillarca granosa TaxID=220873 RepID=A0ABQ9FPS3_TEGGR|nr:hypothetical protein KUTeg_004380 [Tegillarca granosa]
MAAISLDVLHVRFAAFSLLPMITTSDAAGMVTVSSTTSREMLSLALVTSQVIQFPLNSTPLLVLMIRSFSSITSQPSNRWSLIGATYTLQLNDSDPIVSFNSASPCVVIRLPASATTKQGITEKIMETKRYLSPSEIRYTQNSTSNTFGNHGRYANRLIGESLDDILLGNCNVHDIPTITVVRRNNAWYSVDNRRLWVLKKS